MQKGTLRGKKKSRETRSSRGFIDQSRGKRAAASAFRDS